MMLAAGASCFLFNGTMLEKMSYPYFRHRATSVAGGRQGKGESRVLAGAGSLEQGSGGPETGMREEGMLLMR